ncbi:hypothetical protein POSPLADRAFT_1061232 [Postia placenta MAD-698-R-SB12]|uniref:Uncharacterized protein n=1 Tax=Postia placenta MAD-698-R-SB12 TaxID=670580 RepID=A0A1X6MN66_9APHY|nr:hypothetical protein POSPLADRAFT_1061232 [Postia placenta MAD-698-R-SB12]OSX57533.1 hypothetical protein POSPLADRAFT_1061232 [Postia placenta MAD-698-R-SB12]
MVYLTTNIRATAVISTLLFALLSIVVVEFRVLLPKRGRLSGAPEAHKGETVEQEATNFVFGFASLAIGAATGQKEAPHVEQGGAHGETAAEEKDETAVGVGAALPDPTR